MDADRIEYSPAQKVALLAQVDSVCPLCTTTLFYRKGQRTYSQYELAHIYPLKPSADETKLLKDEPRLNADVNHEDNIIPLCGNCHGKFDKPRTVEEYRQLYRIKTELIKRSAQKGLWASYPIEEQINEIINLLNTTDINNEVSEITYESKNVDEKLDASILPTTRRKILNNVSDYFGYVREQFQKLDALNPGASSLIAAQIKAYYLKQRSLSITKQEIFVNIVDWIVSKTRPQVNDTAEIIVSFFVQNCEVFE